MIAVNTPLTALTAGDLMSTDMIRLPAEMPIREAARLLREAGAGMAPVMDEQGRCVGVLSAADFYRCAAEEESGPESPAIAACPYQVKGRLLTGEEAVICTLGEGNCPLQMVRPATGGRHISLCPLPYGAATDRQQVIEHLPGGTVRRYMRTDVVTAGPRTPLPQLSRMMIGAHVHRVIVVDEERRPVGIVSSTDILAAMASTDDEL